MRTYVWLLLIVGIPCGGLSRPVSAQTTAAELLSAAHAAAAERDRPRAIQLASEALRQDPTLASAYYLRGRERFCLGQFAESAQDFDRFAELRPDQRRRLWERGIACYYAGRFREGAEQFQAYQEFDDSDVENAVWHVLCLSRSEGLAAAQRRILKVKPDGRIPMMAIYGLFGGQATPDDVLEVVAQARLTDETRRSAMFYAHLYIGLYHEASGNEALARQHLTLAAGPYCIGHYMGDVARVHAARWDSAVE